MLFGMSKHLFVVARIALSLGIRPPVRSAADALTTSPTEWIPTHQSLHDADRRYHQKEDQSQDYARSNK